MTSPHWFVFSADCRVHLPSVRQRHWILLPAHDGSGTPADLRRHKNLYRVESQTWVWEGATRAVAVECYTSLHRGWGERIRVSNIRILGVDWGGTFRRQSCHLQLKNKRRLIRIFPSVGVLGMYPPPPSRSTNREPLWQSRCTLAGSTQFFVRFVLDAYLFSYLLGSSLDQLIHFSWP